jgi:para-nitrobenzyl esterase
LDGLITTVAGRVRGVEENGVWTFKGIPYAGDPSGPLRWRPPAPAPSWHGVREADHFGLISPQPPPVPGMSIPGDPMESGEDCLSLNVWTPSTAGGSRPVLVWVHGGSFMSGSGASLLYRGDRLSRLGGVVVVTINYRLGALGFVAHSQLAAEGGFGNWGMLDQLAALRWVQENISEFGGDPGNVTVFGESAGAISISGLLASRAAKGLFQRAVIQSGPPACGSGPWGIRRAERFASLVSEGGGSGTGDDDWVGAPGEGFERRWLERVAPQRLVEAAQRLEPDGAELPLPFLPVVDGGILEGSPVDIVRKGDGHAVPLLIGTNRDECTFFALADRRIGSLDEARLRRRIATVIGAELADGMIDGYRKARGDRGEETSPVALWTAITTDLVFRIPSLAFAEAQLQSGAPVYSYLFTWTSPFLGGILGAAHALEVPFVFGTVEERAVQPYSGGGPAAEALAYSMMRSWLSFARSGDPSCEELGEWPAYNTERRPTMVLGEESGVESDPRSPERQEWDLTGVDMGNRLYHL